MPYDNTNTATLADAIELLMTHPDLTDRQHRDMISSINRVATYLKRPPADLPTDAPSLRVLLAKIHPVQAGISAKSLSNVKTALTKALQTVGNLPEPELKAEQTLEWCSFLVSCKAKHQALSLSRLVTYCCNRAIEPEGVNDDVMAEFQAYLDKRLLGKDPAKLCKEMAQTWNGIVKRQGLPLAKLSYQKNSQYRSRPLTTYPVSLQQEIEAYLDKLAHFDLFGDGGPDKPLRPASLRNTRAQLRQFLDALVSSGGEPDAFQSLVDVVTAKNMKAAFHSIMERRKLKSPKNGGLHNIAATLRAIAHHHLCLPGEELEAIDKIKKKTAPSTKGMSNKNRVRLGQFSDWQNVARLLSLPDTLMERAFANPNSRTSGLLAMHAAAITILLSCPMRVKNLAQLELVNNVTGHRNGTHTSYSIRVDAEDVKNLEHIEVSLNPRTSKILHAYIMQFRHLITHNNGHALFPMKSNGASRDPSNLSSDLTALIHRETGLKVHAHLFRHLAARLYLEVRPGDYETVRRLLKHKTLQTTMSFYADLPNQWAHEHYDQVVLDKWSAKND